VLTSADHRARYWRRLAYALSAVIALMVGGAAGLGLYVYNYGLADRVAPADVIVVLGAGSRPNGTITSGYARRARHGVELWRQGLAPRLLCTGGFANRWRTKSEADTCKDYLTEVLLVPESVILMETASRSTEENAIEVKKVMEANNLRTAILVTDGFHMLRSELFFREHGIAIFPSPAQATQEHLRLPIALVSTMREVAALSWRLGKAALQLGFTDTPF
jgi:uncharacterized SAM-binding protein YcdF (DUF218 family)